MGKKISRRTLLLRGLQVPAGAGLALGLASCGGEGAAELVCADPGAMTSAEESVRRTLNYTELSRDPAQVCAGCEFFSGAGEAGGCGSCEIFGGKPVNPDGHCDSWSFDSQGLS